MVKPIPQRGVSKELDLNGNLAPPQPKDGHGQRDIIQALEEQADEM